MPEAAEAPPEDARPLAAAAAGGRTGSRVAGPVPPKGRFTFFSQPSPENGGDGTAAPPAPGVLFGHFQEPPKKRKRFLFF